jgi:hypothetical protein
LMQNSPPRANDLSRWVGVALGLLYFGLCVLWTQHAAVSWNDISRVAAIESLSERGTWMIEESAWFEQTGDKVLLNGKFYSDKMPLMSWVAAGVYGVIRQGMGASLAPDCETRAGTCTYYPLTLLFVGIPASVMVGMMYVYARKQKVPFFAALVGTSALALGTMILPYSLVLNHHVPAAASLFAAFYLLAASTMRVQWRAVGAGLFCALAVALDPLSGILAVALGIIAIIQLRRNALWLVVGAVVPVLLTAWLDVQISGTVIPAYMIPSGYDYEGSIFPATVGGNGTPDNLPQYAFRMFLGAQGLYAYNPILIFALAGMLIVALHQGHALRIFAIVLGLAFLALSIYLATRTGNFGGEAYGERWFVQAIPLLMAFVFFAPPLAQVQGQAVVWWLTVPLFAVALAVSVFSTYQGISAPWRYIPPPAHPTRDAATGAFGWKWETRFPPW